MFILFYRRLVIHITKTIEQCKSTKMRSYCGYHITEYVLAHDQHWEEQNTLTTPQL